MKGVFPKNTDFSPAKRNDARRPDRRFTVRERRFEGKKRAGYFAFITRIFMTCGEDRPSAPEKTSFAVPSAGIRPAGISTVFSTL